MADGHGLIGARGHIPDLMKAAVFDEHGGIDVLRYQDLPVPKPGPNDVLMKVKAAACNYNDLWARRGLPGVTFILPHISGSDASGVVEQVGSAVTNVKIGDEIIHHCGQSCRACDACTRGQEFFCKQFKIFGFQTGPLIGTYGEYVVFPAVQALPKPENLSWEEASTLSLCLVTAWRMLVTRARIQAGDHVLIWGGAGGLGYLAIQICNLFNARPIAVVSGSKKAKFVEELGAEYIIDRDVQNVEEEVKKIVGRRGVDVVFEHVGQETWPTSIQCLRWGGSLVICGATTGFEAHTDLRFVWNKQLTLMGSHMGSKWELLEALSFVESGEINPVISQVLPLRDVPMGQDLMEQNEVVGKIVYVP